MKTPTDPNPSESAPAKPASRKGLDKETRVVLAVVIIAPLLCGGLGVAALFGPAAIRMITYKNRGYPTRFGVPQFRPESWSQKDIELRQEYRTQMRDTVVRSSLKVGMSKAEIINLLGQPDESNALPSGDEHLQWQCSDGQILDVELRHGVQFSCSIKSP